MIYISQNVGHAFFGALTFVLAFAVLYDLTTSKKADRKISDRLWGPVMTATSLIYFIGLTLSLSFTQMSSLGTEQGQHFLLAVFLLLTSLICLRSKFLPITRIIQLFGFAIIMLFHTHSHGGAAWIASYHRWLFTLALTLSALYLILLLTQNRRILTLICITLYITSVSLFIYTQTGHSEAIIHSHSSAPRITQEAEASNCASSGLMHKVEFNKTGNTVEPNRLETATLCDQITIINNTDEVIDIAAGQHMHHVDYPLVSDQIIQPHSQVILNLTKIGKLVLHDHYTGHYAVPALSVR